MFNTCKIGMSDDDVNRLNTSEQAAPSDTRLDIGGDAPIGMTLKEFEEMQWQLEALRRSANEEDVEDDEGRSQPDDYDDDEPPAERGTLVGDESSGLTAAAGSAAALEPEPESTKGSLRFCVPHFLTLPKRCWNVWSLRSARHTLDCNALQGEANLHGEHNGPGACRA